MRINVLRTSIRTTSISRPDLICFVTMVNPVAYQTSNTLPLPKTSTLSSIRPPASVLRLVRSGAFLGRRRCLKDRHQPRPALHTIGTDG